MADNSEPLNINAGDFVLEQNSYGSWYVYGPVTKLTEQRVYYMTGSYTGRDGFCLRRQAMFAGPEKAVRDLYATVRGMSAEHNQRVQQMREQNAEAIARVIAKARAQ